MMRKMRTMAASGKTLNHWAKEDTSKEGWFFDATTKSHRKSRRNPDPPRIEIRIERMRKVLFGKRVRKRPREAS